MIKKKQEGLMVNMIEESRRIRDNNNNNNSEKKTRGTVPR